MLCEFPEAIVTMVPIEILYVLDGPRNGVIQFTLTVVSPICSALKPVILIPPKIDSAISKAQLLLTH